MKQKIILILSIALLTLAIYFTLFENRNSVFNKYNFAIKDTSSINIIIIENANNKIILNKQNNTWKIEKIYDVNKIAIKNVLRVFNNLDFVGKIDKNIKDSISSELDKTGTKITLKENKSIITELIIGNENKHKTGTYVKKTDSEPVIINSEGITNNIAQVISTNSLFWRNKTLFNFNISEIKEVKFYNVKNKRKSFNIKKEHNIFVFKNAENKIIETKANKINRYLSYFRKIKFIKLDNKLSKEQKNKILKNNFAYKINVIDVNNKKYKLKLFLKPNTKNTKYKFDVDYIYGTYNADTNLLIISYFTIDPLLKSIDYFINK